MQNNRNENKPFVIGSHQIVCDDARCSIIIDHTRVVDFSEMQYRALKLLLLLSPGKVVPEEDLLEVVYGESAAQVGHEPLYQLIRRIRSKLQQVGLTVISVEQSGYALLAVPE